MIGNIKLHITGRRTHAFFGKMAMSLRPGIEYVSMGQIQQTKGLASGRCDTRKNMHIAMLVAKQPAAIFELTKRWRLNRDSRNRMHPKVGSVFDKRADGLLWIRKALSIPLGQ